MIEKHEKPTNVFGILEKYLKNILKISKIFAILKYVLKKIIFLKNPLFECLEEYLKKYIFLYYWKIFKKFHFFAI